MRVLFLIGILCLVVLATAALADPACYPVKFAGYHSSFSWSEAIDLAVGQFAVPAADPSQRWRQVLFGRRQDSTHPRLVLHWPLDAPVGWSWTVVPVWCRDTGETAILAVNTQTIESKIVWVYRLGPTWQISLIQAGPAGVGIHLSDRATEGRVSRDEKVRWPKRSVVIRSAYLAHLLLRQQIVAEVTAILRRIGAGSATIAQITSGPPRLFAYYEQCHLGRFSLRPDDLVVDESHHRAVLHFSVEDRREAKMGPAFFDLGYDYQAKRLIEPPGPYRKLYEQDCYP